MSAPEHGSSPEDHSVMGLETVYSLSAEENLVMDAISLVLAKAGRKVWGSNGQLGPSEYERQPARIILDDRIGFGYVNLVRKLVGGDYKSEIRISFEPELDRGERSRIEDYSIKVEEDSLTSAMKKIPIRKTSLGKIRREPTSGREELDEVGLKRAGKIVSALAARDQIYG